MQLDMLQEERDNLHEKVIDKFVILIPYRHLRF